MRLWVGLRVRLRLRLRLWILVVHATSIIIIPGFIHPNLGALGNGRATIGTTKNRNDVFARLEVIIKLCRKHYFCFETVVGQQVRGDNQGGGITAILEFQQATVFLYWPRVGIGIQLQCQIWISDRLAIALTCIKDCTIELDNITGLVGGLVCTKSTSPIFATSLINNTLTGLLLRTSIGHHGEGTGNKSQRCQPSNGTLGGVSCNYIFHDPRFLYAR